MAVFREACPYYLNMGMTYEQYWDGDTDAHKIFRAAKRLKVHEKNRDMWLQALYFYEAMIDVAPYVKAFSKSKPHPFRDEPYDLFEEERAARMEREEQERYEQMKEKVAAFAKAFNEKRHESDISEVDKDARCVP